MSPFGVLTNKTEVTTVITRDVTITWEDPILQKDEKCKLKKVISATGVKTKQDDGSFKMIDELNQLEFHYEERPYDFCNHTFFKLSNLRNAYIELPKIADQQAMLLFNRQHGMCLSYKTLKLVQCQPVEEQWYKLSQAMVILSFKDPSSCMGFIDSELKHTNKQCKMERFPYYKPCRLLQPRRVVILCSRIFGFCAFSGLFSSVVLDLSRLRENLDSAEYLFFYSSQFLSYPFLVCFLRSTVCV
jgi:hypothetical protein